MMVMLLPVMDMDMPLSGLLMVDMLLPAMDIDMPMPGPLIKDMLLPATVMDMPCPRWIRPLPEPSMTDTLSWIHPSQLWICFYKGLDF